jgi:hypothetical protein
VKLSVSTAGLGMGVVTAIAAYGVYYFYFMPLEKPLVEVVVAPPIIAMLEKPRSEFVEAPSVGQVELPSEPALDPGPPLPKLNDSDAAVKSELSALHEASLALLVNDELLRKFVRAINSLSEGKVVQSHRPVQSPSGHFRTESNGYFTADNQREYTIAVANFTRYEIFIDSVLSLKPEQAVGLYQRYYPLLQQAYNELGLKETSFKRVTLKAIAHATTLLPEFSGDEVLLQPSVMYKFADEDVEQLSQVQKLLLRMGPRNSARLQLWLKSLDSKLRL